MNFDFKIRLLGYYNSENQTMNPESIHVEDAERLAKLLDDSFSEFLNDERVVDNRLLEAFKGKGVFIFKDERSHLYAYSPSTHIARISDVKYDRRVINIVDLSYKNWFVPGELFVITTLRKAKFCDLSGNTFEYRENLVSVNKLRDDYFVHCSNSSFVIRWNGTISIQDMKDLVLHRWFFLRERVSSDFCGDCDGWDYSGCDMTRCRHDCEGCGGRRYKCNNSCFFYRHKMCVELCVANNFMEDDLNPAFKYIEELETPFSANCNIPNELISLYEDCVLVKKYAPEYELIECFISKFDSLARLFNFRRNVNNINKVQLIVRSSFGLKKQYLMPVNNFSIEEDEGFLFWGGYQNLIVEGYDYNSDSLIQKQSYPLLQKNKSNTEKMMNMLKEGTLKAIRLEKWTSDDRWRLGYE